MPDVIGCKWARIADQVVRVILVITNDNDMKSTVPFSTSRGKYLSALDLILDFLKRFLTRSITNRKCGRLGVRGVAPRRGSLRIDDATFDVGATEMLVMVYNYRSSTYCSHY